MARVAIALFVCASIFAIERTASACSPCVPTGRAVAADDAEAQPANAGFFVVDVDDPVPYVQAWVDGAPTSVELVDGVMEIGGYSSIVARVVPIPEVGAEIEVVGTPGAICFGESEPAEPLVWVATEVDENVPEALGDPFFDVHDVSTFDMCFGTQIVVYVRGVVPPEPDEQAARRVDVEVTDGNVSFVETFSANAGESDFAVLGGSSVSVDDLCVRTTMWDLAGNRGEPSRWICDPCHVVTSPRPTLDVPDEPAWTDRDLVEDPYCGIAAPPREPPDEPDGTSTTDAPDDATTSAADETTATPDDPSPPSDPDPPADPASGSDSGDATSAGQDGGSAFDRGCACRWQPMPGSGWLVALALAALCGRRRRA